MPLPKPSSALMHRDGPRLALLLGAVLGFMAWASFQLPLSRVGRLAVWGLVVLAGLLGLWGLLRMLRSGPGIASTGASSRGRLVALLILAMVVALVLAVLPAPGVWAWITTLGTLLAVLVALYLGLRIAREGTSVLYRQALLLHKEGDHAAALARLDALDADRLGDAASLQLRTMIHRELGRYDLAHRAAQELVTAHPQLYFGHAEIGLTYLAQGQPAQACRPFTHAAELAPDLAEAHYNLGLACVEAEQLIQAVAPLERALALGLADDADRLIAWYHLYHAYLADDQHDAAAQALRRMRRHRAVLRRWRAALRTGGGSGKAHDQELALIAKIEQVI